MAAQLCTRIYEKALECTPETDDVFMAHELYPNEAVNNAVTTSPRSSPGEGRRRARKELRPDLAAPAPRLQPLPHGANWYPRILLQLGGHVYENDTLLSDTM